MNTVISTAAVAFVLGCLTVSNASIAATEQNKIDQLGNTLTPVGAEQAGNAAGTIPPWEGGLKTPPAGYQKGMHHPDPFADDKLLFKIDQSNVDKYADNLSAGQIALIRRFADYHIPVYPTRRSAAYPEYVYDAIKQNGQRAKLSDDRTSVSGAAISSPFPVPTVAEEVIFNHVYRWRPDHVRTVYQAVSNRFGEHTMVLLEESILFDYSKEGVAPEEIERSNVLFKFMQRVVAPSRLAGSILLVHETADQVKEPRRIWVYNTGQRRVRRAPNVGYDNPGTASDGMRTNDNFDMFNGAPDRYDWQLLGKKEMYIPYNTYKLHSDKLAYDDVLRPNHLNPEHLRYELHRVWVVEATLKEGLRHVYKKRVFYIDEDTWQIAIVDHYDGRDQLWRMAEAHAMVYYEVPLPLHTLEVFYDFSAERYLVLGLDNQQDMYQFDVTLQTNMFTPQALRRMGRK
jgi:hypothetical protein